MNGVISEWAFGSDNSEMGDLVLPCHMLSDGQFSLTRNSMIYDQPSFFAKE